MGLASKSPLALQVEILPQQFPALADYAKACLILTIGMFFVGCSAKAANDVNDERA